MPSSDALILGGGANGLACAVRLAGAGWRVTVLEAAEAPGGTAALVEPAPGFRAPFAHLLQGPDDRVAQAMGLAPAPAQDIATTALSPDGAHRVIRGGRTDGPDAAAFAALHARLSGIAGALAPLRQMVPPVLGRGNAWGRLAKVALGLRRLGAAEFREALRLLLTNVADVAEDELADPLLQGALAFDATLGAWTGPRSPNSLILLLDRLARGALAFPRGGPPALAAAMVRAAERAGVALRCGARVVRIETDSERATGVVLASGERLAADLVVSTLPPAPTLRGLVGPRVLDAGFHTRLGQIRARGAAAKLTLALTAAPDFRGADLRHRLLIAPSVDAVEAAWRPVKYGEVPARPVMEIVLPSAHEPGWAPAGAQVLSAVVQFAPHAPADRAAAKAAFLGHALKVLEDHAPGIGKLTLAADLMMPWETLARFGLPCWHGAELSIEQMLFLRPLPDLAQYRTPVERLWLAGSGSHPGGGISGTAGWNAAGRIVEVGP
jgi:phytoene dehydrogenase-like protein